MSNLIKPIEILLVEDSPSDRLLATEALAQAKILNNIHAVEDGVAAMLFLRRQGKYASAPRPDLILLDLNLPRKDGRAVLAEIKADDSLKMIPVVVLTTSTADEDVLRAYGLHANCYIAKPVEFPKFIDVIHAIESFWFEIVSLPLPIGNLPKSSSPLLPSSALEFKPARPAPKPSDQTLQILLVEDNETDVLLLEIALAHASSIKFEMTRTARLSEAVEKLQVERFDIILTDLGLPDSRGLDTFLKLQNEAKGTPIIVMTGLDEEEFGLRALQSGAQDFLVKHNVSESLLTRSIRYAIERRHLEEQLRQSQRLEAVGQLAGGIAHDFNNLLTIIQGHAMMMVEGSEPHAIADSAQAILKAAKRAEALTRQLLAFSRKQVMRKKNVDVNETIAQMTGLLNHALGENVRLQVQYGSDLPPVRADVGMIEQIILNLMVNAREAMPGGGKVTIITSFSEIDEAFVRRKVEATAGEFVTITVSDTGTGIPKEVLPRIFEPFFTTKDISKGSGLGLATAYGIVKQHQGWIDVQSKVGEGTTFQIHIPALTDVVLPASEAPSPKVESPRGNETILLVEDESGLRTLVASYLVRNGYKVLEACQGMEALHLWNRYRAEIHLLLTDMVMPDGISGRELAEKLSTDKPELKVIFTSGYNPDMFGETKDFMKPGQKFLAKPYVPTALLQLLRDTLDQK